ncbi:hypothetical protein ACS0TY_022467 [Phlomoides rotata]
MASYHKSLSLLIPLICLISFVHSINNNGDVTIDLIHRDSPLSPFHDPSQTRFQRLRNAIDCSFSRKSSLLSKSTSKPLTAPLSDGGGEYLIEYQIGTPPVRQLSVADTGSDLTWVQCEPCTSCYKQDYPPFNPVASKSYNPVACQTNQCLHAGTTCGENNVCQYKQSYSQGVLAAETLTLGSAATFPNFVFGCGINNSGSGIFGLGRGAISIINQTAASTDGSLDKVYNRRKSGDKGRDQGKQRGGED